MHERIWPFLSKFLLLFTLLSCGNTAQLITENKLLGASDATYIVELEINAAHGFFFFPQMF